MDRKTLLIALAGLALLAGVVLFAFRDRALSGVSSRDSSADVVAALDRINENQAKLAERLDRLEMSQGMPVPPGMRSAPGTLGYRPAPGAANASGQTSSPADDEAKSAQQLHAMEDRLVRDPLSPQWAGSNESNINTFLTADKLKKEQLPVPKNASAECRSHLCRISMTFADESEASQTQERLLMAIAPTLPNAQTFLLPKSDGTVEMVIFAGDAASTH